MSAFTTVTQRLQRCCRHRHLPLPILVRFFGRDATRSAVAKNPKSGAKANAYSVAYAPGDKFQNVEKLFRLLGFTGAFGTAAYFILPNVYVWQVQQFYQHHSKGVPTRVPAQLKALVLEVMDEVLDKPKDGVLGSDVSHAVQDTEDHGISLKQSILLTEEAKKFLIARELERVKGSYFYPPHLPSG